jgi:4,5-DOPA dioxygenase extradiol
MTLPTLFVPHGGGPCFFMDPDGGPPDPMWQSMQAYLAGLIDSLAEKPRAILLVSGHWEEDRVTVHTGNGQPLLFDYYGFPEHTYRLRWDAPGSPEVAARVKGCSKGRVFRSARSASAAGTTACSSR